MPRSDAWLPMILLAVLAALTLWLTQAMKIRPQKAALPVGHEADAVMENFSAIQYDEQGGVRSVLKAGKMLHYPDDGSSRLQRVQFEGRDPQQAPFNVRANEGTVSKDRKDVYFYGAVRAEQLSLTGQAPLVVTTEKLHVRPEEGIARTDLAVVIEQAGGKATALSLEIDNKTRTAKLTHVRATYQNPSQRR